MVISYVRTSPQKPAKQFWAGWFFVICLILVTLVYSIFLNLYFSPHAGSEPLATSRYETRDEPLPLQQLPIDSTLVAPKVKHDSSIPPVIDGIAPVISTVPTKEPVVFLGIDDGGHKEAFELQLMRANHVKASLFLADLFIANNPAFFKGFTNNGSVIENHTVNHRLLTKMSYAEQKAEICDEADLLEQQFGKRPILFRPPGGSYNLDTQRAAAACGMRAVVLWIAKANGGSMQYQYGDGLRPGDIVLMHFRPEFKQDMQAFLNAQKAAGLHTELLEDWL